MQRVLKEQHSEAVSEEINGLTVCHLLCTGCKNLLVDVEWVREAPRHKYYVPGPKCPRHKKGAGTSKLIVRVLEQKDICGECLHAFVSRPYLLGQPDSEKYGCRIVSLKDVPMTFDSHRPACKHFEKCQEVMG